MLSTPLYHVDLTNLQSLASPADGGNHILAMEKLALVGPVDPELDESPREARLTSDTAVRRFARHA